MISAETDKYKIFFIKDERGNTSHHFAEEKKWAIQAHIEHWGYEGLRTSPRVIELMSTAVAVCSEQTCTDAARIPSYALPGLKNR